VAFGTVNCESQTDGLALEAAPARIVSGAVVRDRVPQDKEAGLLKMHNKSLGLTHRQISTKLILRVSLFTNATARMTIVERAQTPPHNSRTSAIIISPSASPRFCDYQNGGHRKPNRHVEATHKAAIDGALALFSAALGGD
jgi:hypothetical protein